MGTEEAKKVIHKELSYKIVGALYEVYNRLGFGYQEKIYQRAVEEELFRLGVPFKRESFSRVNYKGKVVGFYFQDFLIEDKIVLEMKVGDNLYQRNINQVLSYLKDSGKKLGIVAVFTRHGVIIRRVLN
ncbi:MAG: GxxExxY protein [Patescibacteria group bacterium]